MNTIFQERFHWEGCLKSFKLIYLCKVHSKVEEIWDGWLDHIELSLFWGGSDGMSFRCCLVQLYTLMLSFMIHESERLRAYSYKLLPAQRLTFAKAPPGFLLCLNTVLAGLFKHLLHFSPLRKVYLNKLQQRRVSRKQRRSDGVSFVRCKPLYCS